MRARPSIGSNQLAASTRKPSLVEVIEKTLPAGLGFGRGRMEIDHLVLAIEGDPEGTQQNLFLNPGGSLTLEHHPIEEQIAVAIGQGTVVVALHFPIELAGNP